MQNAWTEYAGESYLPSFLAKPETRQEKNRVSPPIVFEAGGSGSAALHLAMTGVTIPSAGRPPGRPKGGWARATTARNRIDIAPLRFYALVRRRVAAGRPAPYAIRARLSKSPASRDHQYPPS